MSNVSQCSVDIARSCRFPETIVLKSLQHGRGKSLLEKKVRPYVFDFRPGQSCCRSEIPAGLDGNLALVERSFAKPQFQAFHSKGVSVEFKLVSKQALRIN